jgi:hypothetical protein
MQSTVKATATNTAKNPLLTDQIKLRILQDMQILVSLDDEDEKLGRLHLYSLLSERMFYETRILAICLFTHFTFEVSETDFSESTITVSCKSAFEPKFLLSRLQKAEIFVKGLLATGLIVRFRLAHIQAPHYIQWYDPIMKMMSVRWEDEGGGYTVRTFREMIDYV